MKKRRSMVTLRRSLLTAHLISWMILLFLSLLLTVRSEAYDNQGEAELDSLEAELPEPVAVPKKSEARNESKSRSKAEMSVGGKEKQDISREALSAPINTMSSAESIEQRKVREADEKKKIRDVLRRVEQREAAKRRGVEYKPKKAARSKGY